MYELKKNGKVFMSKYVGTGPSSYEKKNLPGCGLTKVEKHCSPACDLTAVVFPLLGLAVLIQRATPGKVTGRLLTAAL